MLLVVCSLYLSAAQGKKVRPKNRGCTATVAITSSALLLTAAADDKSVRQTPPSITKREGDALVSGIKCSHSISSYNQIYWYKQDESRALKLLGYLNTNIQNVEEDVKGKISFDGDGRSGSSLSIAAVGLKDSGVYFCAASLHSAAGSPQDNTQTPAVSPRREEPFHSEATKMGGGINTTHLVTWSLTHLSAASLEPSSTNNNIFNTIEVVSVPRLKVHQAQSRGAVNHQNLIKINSNLSLQVIN
uniref:Ig-like domain-containing protein n=1 Tax=Takifugu rubripes TaxID=31033 RepID=A0A3B5K879_TAKRU